MSSRYLIGVDLGTTNCAAAYVDTREALRGGRPVIHRFAIPQVVNPGEMAARDTLPSFLYYPTEEELSRDLRTLGLPRRSRAAAKAGPSDRRTIVGAFARDHGALVPGRQVSSAKSWLCNPAVDRVAPILPWGHSEEEPGCSPVTASARYLAHIRDGWNETHAGDADTGRFENQAIVLTVPASFDEEARELTVQAAREAGLQHVTLLEEPLAAFYAWMASHAASLRRRLHNGDVVLVCDVGGGTTDFTVIRAVFDEDEVGFERTAVGEHLLLGGDNLDLALARHVEAKLGGVRLTLRQQHALARLTSAAKETLLGERAPGQVAIAIPAAGSAMVGGRLSATLTRREVEQTLRDGFLPRVAASDVPAHASRAGLREFGLPYTAEPAITRHLAAFLARATAAGPGNGVTTASGLLRPDAILFNGGFFTPPAARQAIVETLQSWFEDGDPGWTLRVLENRNPASAVALGAAHYAFVGEHGGLRVSGGSARAYYVGLRTGNASSEVDIGHRTPDPGRSVTAICVLARGTEEGTTLDLTGSGFSVATNRPIAFPLYSSTVRRDRPGDVVHIDPNEVHEHAPLVTILRYGKKSHQTELPIHLSAQFTEVGTLEMWCHSDVSEHRWRLRFELRTTEHAVDENEEAGAAETPSRPDTPDIVLPDESIDRAAELVRGVFRNVADRESPDAVAPETLVAQLEAIFGYARQAWPLAVIRRLADVLLETMEGRKKGPRFEARWLNLTGFCLRPGFGATLDEWRMEQMRRVYLAGLSFPKELQGHAEWFVLWQRVAGGLSAGQQHELLQRYRTQLGIGGKKDMKRINPQVEREGWRLLASLERLPPSVRVSLGNELVRRLARQPDNAAFLWSLGRLGARIPSHGPLNTVVPATEAARWLEGLLSRRRLSADAQLAAVQIAARTDDPHRDVDDPLRARAIECLTAAGASPDEISRVRSYVPPAAADAVRMFGETLPLGLRLTDQR